MTDRQEKTPQAASFSVAGWHVDPTACRITRSGETVTLEPKVMDMLCLLASEPGRVWSRDELLDRLWNGFIVGEDTLARTVSRLRKALDDDAKSPRYVETIPKRGYRLIAPVAESVAPDGMPAPSRPAWLLPAAIAVVLILIAGAAILFIRAPEQQPQESLAATLTGRGDDFYIRMTEADNEAAILLYERAIADAPDHAPAYAGLANALVQRVVRWQQVPGGGAHSLGEAMRRGLTQTPQAKDLLERAHRLAERGVALAPDDPVTLKALGFVVSAEGDLERAADLYGEAIGRDENAWAPLINLGEIYLIRNEPEAALPHFVGAYDAMERIYTDVPQQVGPWHAELGVEIGLLQERLGNPAAAEAWYRRVLTMSPLEPEATARLAHILETTGDQASARELCTRLAARTGTDISCPAEPVTP